ncbi:phosphoserine transaminase [Kocuria rhizophila]|uniref:phosphoserine transaminase n=1 Tax=Kocuria rhizophila TaxID=72000 RepID=UPI0006809D50|nr:phosphoserine transaminase [Kocuria rhizophila]ASE12054.1 phosphoserine transaminase [Kocuria rhizophila]
MGRPAPARPQGALVTSTPVIPAHLLPEDGRFGAGPSRVRPEQLAALAREGTRLLGTSHRQNPVKDLVARVQAGLARFFDLPAGYEMVLGLGGASTFWDSAAFSLVRSRAEHLVFGEFGAKFASVTDRAPFLERSHVIEAPAGSRPAGPRPEAGVDVYAWPQNETSTGVAMPVRRVPVDDALTVVDATSAAGGMAVDLAQTDVYYFSPQKNFGSDGGIWFAAFSPAALERVERIAASDRWIPDVLSLATAVENSRKHQTYNTPALAGLVMLDEQVRWLNEQGGLQWAAARTAQSSSLVYEWAESSPVAHPFVAEPEHRSPVVCTVDFDDAVDAARVAGVLRANGVVDVDPYRKLGRNQLRIATFASVPPSDVRALLECIDWTVAELA